ncbi:RagB/SusD family nutrient uptake outer membrane protein [Bacteroides sp. 51]|uniref:RagB/SusD family nutrient uptake outer membrane protein n=1 Tax=Bacteroides sp. 51 TaxID=2302938 RepID=UPI0013D725C4|nr:RagB/SusD family nutrient uptake outer membrane protein [Bacteroides sp. 51]NDV81770.1 RagB/SusD family nutrient uptake outer membrane protein [Bacteroides sp. 51]
MKNWKTIIMSIALGGMFVGCQDLDIPPKNILSGSDIYNEGGITAYMAGLYGRLPMEDFNTTDQNGHEGFFHWNNIVWDMLGTGETVNRNKTDMYTVQKGYWKEGYQIIRQANVLIQDLPNYVGQLTGAEKWLAEARFIRAYTYFAMVKRYGGVPIIEIPQESTGNDADLWAARNSHEECVDFILADLDYAMENMDAKIVQGRANKYGAAAFKSRVALYAGSVARYGKLFDYSKDGVQLCGIPASKANNYFQQAFDAAVAVDAGGYALYEADGDKAVNFRNIFMKADVSKESIFTRQYEINNNVHSFDHIYCTPRMTADYGDRYNVTLDWVELFDGLPLDPATGRLKTTDANGNYIVYNDEKELFANAEPRLKGSVMMPGETYKGVTLDIRAGLIKENIDPSTPIAKFVADDGQTTTNWTNNPWFKNNVKTSTEDPRKQTPETLSTGKKVYINGQDGPNTGTGNNTLTGFHGLKWINLNWSVAETQMHRSTQTWIDIRYAEVLLNRAEAAIELGQNGVASYAGKDMLQDAMTCINKVRTRAGANLLTSTAELADTPIVNGRGTGKCSFVFAPNKGLHVIRVERYKELAFEHSVYWDLRRWFTYHEQINNYRRRMLAPFLFAKGADTDDKTGNPIGKYIYDTRVVARNATGAISFATKNYYDKIPDGQLKTNPLLEQNDQY